MASLDTPYKSTWNKNKKTSNTYNKSPLTSPTGYDTYGLLGGQSIYTNYGQPAVSNSNKKNEEVVGPKPAPTLASYPTSKKSSGSSGGSTVSSYSGTLRPYLDAMLSAFNQGADANKALAKQTYDVTIGNLGDALNRAQQTYDQRIRDIRESLNRAQGSYDTGAATAREDYTITEGNLKRALERFQAQNAKNVENQRKSYLTDQAALESARLEADRQTRIDAAARGLGGSGLQQLAQLQNLLNQGQDISNLATENQGVLDKLRTQLIEAEEDTASDIAEAARKRDNTLKTLQTILDNAKADASTQESDALTALDNAKAARETGAQNAWTVYENALKGINADLAKSIADAEYNFGQNAYSSSQRGTGSSSLNEASILASAYGALEQDFDTDLAAIYRGKGSAKKKAEAAESLYDAYKKKSSELYGGYGSNYKSLQDINLSNFKTLKDYYKNK